MVAVVVEKKMGRVVSSLVVMLIVFTGFLASPVIIPSNAALASRTPSLFIFYLFLPYKYNQQIAYKEVQLQGKDGMMEEAASERARRRGGGGGRGVERSARQVPTGPDPIHH